DLRHVRNLHIAVLLPRLGQDLEAHVLGDVAVGVVGALDPVEDHGRRAGREVDALHGQLFGRGFLEVESESGGGCEERGQDDRDESDAHGLGPLDGVMRRFYPIRQTASRAPKAMTCFFRPTFMTAALSSTCSSSRVASCNARPSWRATFSTVRL